MSKLRTLVESLGVRLKVLTGKSAALEFLCLTLISCGAHFIALRYIFPGVYDPFWPSHSDYYMGTALAHGASSILDAFYFPRPVAYFYIMATGYLGIRASIAISFFLTVASVAMVSMILRRLLKDRTDILFLCGHALFSYLVFTQPFYYSFGSYDSFSQLSFLLLTISALLVVSGRPVWTYAITSILAMLAKETFALSALLLASAWWFDSTRKNRIWPLVTIFSAVVVAAVVNKIRGSVFTNGVSAAYRIDLSPGSIYSEFSKYYTESTSIYISIVLACCLLFCLLAAPGKKTRMALFLAPLAASLAILPNSLLPNHHYAGYSYGVAPLFFITALLPFALFPKKTPVRYIILTIAGAILITPATLHSRYATNAWVLEQQQRQKKLLTAIQGNSESTGGRLDKILVCGVDFPFNPFDHSHSLKSFKGLENAEFHVVAYQAGRINKEPFDYEKKISTPAQRIDRDDVVIGKYNQIWMFNHDGSSITSPWPSTSAGQPFTSDWLSEDDLLLYPALNLVLKDCLESPTPKSPDGWQYMKAGESLLAYKAFGKAAIAFKRSIDQIPNNAYIRYCLGTSLEGMGNLQEGEKEISRALEIEPNNQGYKATLKRLRDSSLKTP